MATFIASFIGITPFLNRVTTVNRRMIAQADPTPALKDGPTPEQKPPTLADVLHVCDNSRVMEGTDWIEIPRDGVMPQYAAPYSVSMNPRGDIMMSKRTWENMGRPAAFKLLYDPARSRIGLKTAGLDERNAYPVRELNRSGAKLIRGHRLLKEHRLVIAQTVRFYDADLDQHNILILDLRTARPSPGAASHWKKRG